MANRRETADKVGGRGGRGSNKENKLASKGDESEKIADKSVDKSVRRTVSLELPSARTLVHQPSAGPSRLPGAEVPLSPAPPVLADAPGLSEPVLQQELFGALSRTDPTDGFDDSFFQIWHHKSLLNTAEDDFFFRATPPQTPGLSPSKSSATKPNIPPESPYDPTRTPAFRHSPARLPSDQPWRASGAAVSSAVRQLTLGMLVCGEASPNVRGLDVSPIVIVPASERKKRSVFSPPSNQTPGSERMFSLLDMHGDIEPDMLFPSPRRLFADVQHTPSIMSRMGDFAWPSPMKGFNSMGFNSALASAGLTMDAGLPTPSGEVEDPFKAYLHLSPAPKVAGDSSPSHPPSSSRSNSPASRSKSDVPPPPPELQASPSPVFGPSRSSISMSKLRLRVFPENDDDVDMDGATDPKAFNRKVDMASLGLGTPLRVQEHLHSRGDSSSSVEASFSGSSSAAPSSSGSDKAPVSSGSTGSTHSRRDSSPFRFGSHGRQRSASGSSHKSSLGSSSVATVGLMDKILGRQEKPQRRRTSHNHDGEVAVDSMGSPFKLGRKTSRNEFLYSLDGDCEMQEAQPKKRRKTISGRE
ncbi:hypothetical protein C8Q77DRAFT_1043616 [Trametes polyzona]|nr:hypothetical protein C8Q77DRAFT_1043616 [Trametes polyzona]